jgi:glycosyltransferase involved in cell wall biosynthesis
MGWENIFGRVAARRAGVRAVVGSVRCTQLPVRHIAGEALTHKMADAIIVNSVGIRDELVRRARIPKESIDVVENGVDLARFSPLGAPAIARERKLWGMDGRRVLVMPGRICDQKNQKEVLRALVSLKHDGDLPEDVRVIFAGRGSPPWFGEALRAYSTLSGLGPQVEFVGIVKQVEKLVGAADAMLLPSNYEGLPNAVIEGMACGVPVIVSHAANTDELVTDGKEGLVCEDNRSAGIARALRRFFALSAAERAAMGAAGHEHATTRFAVSRMVARTVEVYTRVLGGLPKSATEHAQGAH